MTAEPSALARLARLRDELEIDRAALNARAAETASLLAEPALSRERVIVLAVNLHGYYTALEALFERVARLLDESVPVGPTWHVDLVAQMQTDVPSLRPPVVPPSAAGSLHALRKFRHFFRNAYVLELDEQKTRAQAETLVAVHASVSASLDAFRAHLLATLAALAAG